MKLIFENFSGEKNPDLTMSLLTTLESLLYTFEGLKLQEIVDKNFPKEDVLNMVDYSKLENLQLSEHHVIFTVSKRIIDKYFENTEILAGEMEIE